MAEYTYNQVQTVAPQENVVLNNAKTDKEHMAIQNLLDQWKE